MGRRKIEIQPITHERNRSVTFLKRKNGLFKKAYELGVLCSVDVAVIIFEQRPGHHVKLYQYCSSDVHKILERHMQFDGEKDLRTPADFNNHKTEEAAEDEEDAEDEEGSHQGKRPDGGSPSKIQGNSAASGSQVPIRPNTNGDISLGIEMDYRAHARISPANSTATLPISGERHSVPTTARGTSMSKRQRMEDMPQHVQSAPAVVGNGSYPYRLEVDLNFPPPGGMSALHPSVSQGASHLASLYSSAGIAHSSQPPFLPQAPFDFSRHHPTPTLRTVSFPSQSPSPYPPRQAAYQPPQTTNSMFVDLLSAGGEHGHGSHPSQFSTFDWPVHGQQQQDGPRSAPSSQSSHEHWLDFLSPGQPSAASNPTVQLPPPVQHHTRPPSNSVSSQRSTASYALPPSASSSEGMSPGVARKRSRDVDEQTSEEEEQRSRSRANGTSERVKSERARSGDIG